MIDKLEKLRLGDGVYVEFDDYYVILTTHDGIKQTNVIFLEPSVWKSLREYVNTIELANG